MSHWCFLKTLPIFICKYSPSYNKFIVKLLSLKVHFKKIFSYEDNTFAQLTRFVRKAVV